MIGLSAPLLAQNAPPAVQLQDLDQRQRQALVALTTQVIQARRVGGLAELAAADPALRRLGESIVATSGDIAWFLERSVTSGLPSPPSSGQEEITRLEELARGDAATLRAGLLGWVEGHYPEIIRNIEFLGNETPGFAPLAESVLARLREQLSTAQGLRGAQ